MPVRGFDGYLREKSLINRSDISSLKGCRIGVDGFFWLRKIIKNDPLQPAIGGISLTLESTIKAGLAKFKEAEITPIFVFNGVQMVRDRPFGPNERVDKRAINRLHAWENQKNGNKKESARLFSSCSQITADTINYACKYFKENGVEYFKAPILSWAQLSWLENSEQSYLHACVGGLELVLFGVNRTILSLEFETGVFEWVSKSQILRAMNFTMEQLVDLCILAGFDYSQTFPPLLEQHHFSFVDAINLITSFPNGLAIMAHYMNHPQVSKVNYAEAYAKAKCIINHQVVLKHGCICEPLNPNKAPNDLHLILSHRLPNDIYFYLSQGLVSPQIFNNLVSGYLVELAPLCCGETVEYRRFLDQLHDVRAKTIALVTQNQMDEYYQKKKIITLRWFDHHNEHELIHDKNPLVNGPFVVSDMTVYEQFGNLETDLLTCIKTQLNEKQRCINTSIHPQFVEENELLVSVNLTTLMLSGYLNDNGIPTKEGITLSMANGYAEPMFILLELLRNQQLTSAEYTSTKKGTSQLMPERNEVEEAKRLISRVLSLIEVHFAGDKTWDGDVSYDLICFNGLVKAASRTYRNLTEMVLLTSLRAMKNEFENVDYSGLAYKIPFFHEANCAMGLMFLKWLEIYDQEKNGDIEEKFQSAFSFIPDANVNLKNGFMFWDQVIEVVKSAHKNELIPLELFEQFDSANNYLAARRELYDTK